MSVAFTKEDSAETASETLLPDRPISPHPNLVTEAGLKALESQLHQAREAYEQAQTIEDVNERRRQAASPLRDVLRDRDDLKLLTGCADDIPNSFAHQKLCHRGYERN